ncbi:MAG: choline transporter [Bdellovibrionaceae bacterium]|nr:choline transporter [Pseudobdellovibrionaceae bacterium]
MNKRVFFGSAIFILALTVIASLWPQEIEFFFKHIQAWLIKNTGWIYVLAVGTFLFFSFILMVSRLGDIKLGPDHSQPEFNDFSWYSMLFSAGMGIGLMFWGVAEPIMHFSSPPIGEGGTILAAREAMKITFFHWGLHAWAIYALFAVILAYFAYRKDLPLLPRSALAPFIGEKINGPIGDIVDTVAIIGTMFGVSASLGLGVTQINAGLNYLFQIPQTSTVQVILIAIITMLATISVVLGLDGGIKKLSNINVLLATIMMLTILFVGDTIEILQSFIQNTGAYLSEIIYKTFNLYAYEKKEQWIGGWTLLYWAWWIAWAPFVGMFIARISKGRTIRQFMAGGLFVPTGFTFLWMSIFGNSALNLILNKNAVDLKEAVNLNVSIAVFKFFEHFPASSVLSILAIILVVTFFVSSSDSGSLVIDTLASGGKEEPPLWQRIFWALTEGVVASILLLAGGLDALQTMTIVSAFPIIILMTLGSYALIKSLREDWLHMNSVQNHNTVLQYTQTETSWKERLTTILEHPEKNEVISFLTKKVRPALLELRDEMAKKGLDVELIERSNQSTSLNVKKDGVDDFIYKINIRKFDIPEYIEEKQEKYFRAEVFLITGGQDYDIYGYTQEQILADALTQYEKHIQFLHLNQL